MALIEVPLNLFRYHFRRLTWQDETRLTFPPGEDQRKILLSVALVDISGMKVTREEALTVLKQIPDVVAIDKNASADSHLCRQGRQRNLSSRARRPSIRW